MENIQSSKPIITVSIFGERILDEFLYCLPDNNFDILPEPNRTIFTTKDFDYYNYGLQGKYTNIIFEGGSQLIVDLLRLLNIKNNFIKIHHFQGTMQYITREILKKYEQIETCSNKNIKNECKIRCKTFRGDIFLGISPFNGNNSVSVNNAFEITYNSIQGKIGFFSESLSTNNSSAYLNRYSFFCSYEYQKYNEIIIEMDEKDNIKKNEKKIIIIYDSGPEFRQDKQILKHLNENISNDSQIFLKICPPFTLKSFNEEYKNVLKKFSDRITIFTYANIFRLTGSNISYQLSWEKTIRDLLFELEYNPNLKIFHEIPKIVIRFGLEGALVINNKNNSFKDSSGSLIYCPYSIEDEFIEKNSGNIQGISNAFFVGYIHSVLGDNSNDKEAISYGLHLANKIWNWGYGVETFPMRIPKEILTDYCFVTQNCNNCNLLSKICLHSDSKPQIEIQGSSFSEVAISVKDIVNTIPNDNWTILGTPASKKTIGKIAYKICRNGLDNSNFDEQRFPVLKIGQLVSVVRSEIESYQSIKNIIKSYLNSSTRIKPLSIGVFGPPGSGKSFGITEILKNIRPSNVEIINYNLSQFTDQKQLISAFHKIRDYSLINKLPLVFFDEFDCNFNGQRLGWIKYFLAPMQDGSFFDGEISHPLGKCIFVFAGGTCHTYEDFSNLLKPDQENDEETKELKIRDFLSRLKGHINIYGCNPLNKDDKFYKIRRAILLRSIIQKVAPEIIDNNIIQIEDEVLRALIKVPEYLHGVRSMESIIETSNFNNRDKFSPASLVNYEQLKHHVDPEFFINLLQRDIDYEAIKEQLKIEINKEQILFAEDSNCETFVNEIPSILREKGYGFVRKHSSPRYNDYYVEENNISDENIKKILRILERVHFKLYLY